MVTRKGKAALAAGLAMSTVEARVPTSVPAPPPVSLGVEAMTELPEGKTVADRFFGLLADVNDWGDVSKEKIEKAMQFTLVPGRGKGSLSFLGHLRDGSSFFVNYYPASANDHPYLSLNVSLSKEQRQPFACPISFDSARQRFLAMGFKEAEVLNDIGSATALQYTRGMLTFNIDAITTSATETNGRKAELCLDSLTTI